MTDGNEARAARAAARAEPIRHTLGDAEFVFAPELPLDVVLAYDTLGVQTASEIQAWTVAHLLEPAECDTECADDGLSFSEGRDCPAEKALRKRLRKVRVGRRRLTQTDLEEFHAAVLDSYAVTQGESDSSADSPAGAGESSSGTVSEQGSTPAPSGDPAAAAPAASGPSSS